MREAAENRTGALSTERRRTVNCSERIEEKIRRWIVSMERELNRLISSNAVVGRHSKQFDRVTDDRTHRRRERRSFSCPL